MSPRFTVEATTAGDDVPSSMGGNLPPDVFVKFFVGALETYRAAGARITVEMGGTLIATVRCADLCGDLVWRTEPVKAGK